MAPLPSRYGVLLLSLAAAEIALLLWYLNAPPTATLAVALLGLASGAFDNLLIGLGSALRHDRLLETLSTVRFVLHAIVVPLLLVPSAQLFFHSWLVAAAVAALLLIAYELSELFPIVWKPSYFSGTLRLVKTNVSGPPLVTIAVTVFTVITGFLLQRDSGNAVLLIGALAGLVGNGLPSSRVGTFPGALGEALLFGSVLLAQQQLQSVGYMKIN